jgi:uncharacterized protein YbaP (TraB family)
MNWVTAIICGLFTCLYCASTSFAQGSNIGVTSPALWAWEIQGKERKIYVIGELHSFVSEAKVNIDYQFGIDLYNRSAEVWAEAKQTNTIPLKKISSYLDQHEWSDLAAAVRRVIHNTSLRTQEGKEKLYLEFLAEVNASDAYSAYANLLLIAELHTKFKNPQLKVSDGISKKLTSYDANSSNRKIRAIETSTAVADMWSEHCDTKDNMVALMKAATRSLNESLLLEKNINTKTQDIFLSPTSTVDEIAEYLLTEAAGQVITNCFVVTRNKLWLPKILEVLEAKGPPVAFLMGIGHVGGPSGVLALLKNAGFTDARRIYSVN